MRIITSNLWGDYFQNPTAGRDEQLYGIYQTYSPDVLGFQEATDGWYQSTLFKQLSRDYRFIGTERFEANNFVPMAIKNSIELLSKGFEYLEHTPDVSKAITWAVVRQGGIVFAVCNTHFWWMRGSESEEVQRQVGVWGMTFDDHCQIRAKNAMQITRLMNRLRSQYNCPVFAFGDMNATVTESVFDVYEQNGIKHLFDVAREKDTSCTIHGDPVKDASGRFHGTKATDAYLASHQKALCLPMQNHACGHLFSIDHILALGSEFEVKQYRVIEDQDALDATDHSPVLADIEFRSAGD